MSNNRRNNENSDVSKKIDKLMEMMENSEEKASRRHKEIKSRLEAMENKCVVLETKVKKCIRTEDFLCSGLAVLQEKVNLLEQEKLKRNVIIQGVPEREEDDTGLKYLAAVFLNAVDKSFSVADITSVKRIGFKRNTDSKRIIVVKLITRESKESLVKAAKKCVLNCSLTYNGSPLGKKEDRVFISDHLTKLNQSLFYEARNLRRSEIVKFAWVSNGNVLIKKNENSKPIRLTSVDQLTRVKEKLGVKMNSTKVNNSDSEEDNSQPGSDDESAGSDLTDLTHSHRGQKRNSSFVMEAAAPQRLRSHTHFVFFQSRIIIIS